MGISEKDRATSASADIRNFPNKFLHLQAKGCQLLPSTQSGFSSNAAEEHPITYQAEMSTTKANNYHFH
jgi:hypothetical protein